VERICLPSRLIAVWLAWPPTECCGLQAGETFRCTSDQGAARDRGDLVDGRHVVSAAAVRLPLRREIGSKQSETFKVMERRLLKAIMTPAMIVTWLAGFTSPGRATGFRHLGCTETFAGRVAIGVHGFFSSSARPSRRIAIRKSEILSRYHEVPTF